MASDIDPGKMLAVRPHRFRRRDAQRNARGAARLAGTVTSALLGNAFVCAAISGPDDRYGARMAWLATTVLLIAAIRHFTGDDASPGRSLPT
jgi:peptidoglycan/LPS O-acetylase OafA/YrhL